MQDPTDPLQQLPIDVTYSKLADWLVDRRKLPADWRKKLVPIRNRVAAALPGLPKDVDPWFGTLTHEVTGYLESKRIMDELTAAKPEARTLFGRLSGAAGEWDAIVRAYEKDLLYLGEAAQIMVQNVNYEIPYQKKQITKLQQQLADLERKETEYKRNAAAAALKYHQACQELGVQGKNVRMELLATAKTLPNLFTEVVEVLCCNTVGQALECYEAFFSYAHTKEGAESDTVVPTLKKLRDSPFASHTSEISGDGNAVPDVLSSQLHVAPKVCESNMSNLDRNIGTEENEAVSIDWDIGSVDVSAPSSNLVESRPAQNLREQESEIKQTDSVEPLANYLESIQEGNLHSDPGTVSKELPSAEGSGGDIDWDTGDIGEFDNGQSEIQWDIGNIEQLKNDQLGIQWDISIEDGIGVPGISPESLDAVSDLSNAVQESDQKYIVSSRFVETDYRNSLLDDLFEIRTFLTQRVEEINREETSSLQNQVQAVSPQVLQQYGSDSFKGMTADISRAISLLTNKKTRDLIMILTSRRFLDRLEASLNQKKQQEVKLLENLKDLGQKRLELRNMLSLLWPKQEAALLRTREVKELCEKTISTLYEGRHINVIGEINSVLGQA